MSEWYPYEDGDSIGRGGPAGGTILRDEELGNPEDPEDADARVTLERGGDHPPFSLTVNLYGWMQQARSLPDEGAAGAAADAAKPEMERLAALIPGEDARKIEEKVAQLNAAIDDFTRRFV